MVKVLPWAVVFAIQFGFLLAGWSEWTGLLLGFFKPVRILGALLILPVVVFGWAGLFKQRRRGRPHATRVPRWGWVVVALVCGVFYGEWRATHPLVRVPTQVLGLPVGATAAIVGLHNFPNGLTVNLRVREIRLDTSRTQVQAQAVWFYRRPTPEAADWRIHDQLQLSGVFVTQQANSRSTLPEQRTLSPGPVVQFSGRALAWTPSPPSPFMLVRSRINQAMHRVSAKGQEPDEAVLSSIVFGGSDIEAATKQAFLQAGLLHVLAASGANVLLLEQALELTVLQLWQRLRLPYWTWVFFLIGFIWYFSGLCSFAPSIVRASIMSSYVLMGKILQRKTTVAASLRLTALLEAGWDPALLATTSSILSFMATAAIAAAISDLKTAGTNRRSRNSMMRMKQYVMQMVFINLRVELYLIPVSLYFFNQMTPFSLLSNLFAGPLLTVLLPLSVAFMVVSLFGSLASPLALAATWLGQGAYMFLHLLLWLVKQVSSWPFALVTVHLPSLWWALFYYGVLLSLPVTKWFVKK